MRTFWSWFRAIATDVALAFFAVQAWQGVEWAANVLTFYGIGFSAIGIVLFAFVVGLKGDDDARKAGSAMNHSAARLAYDNVTGHALAVYFAAMGWFGCATLWFLLTIFHASAVQRVNRAFKAAESATA